MSRSHLETILERVTECRSDVAEIKEIVTGNGDPDKGLVVQVAKIRSEMNVGKWIILTVAGAIIGGMGLGAMNKSDGSAGATTQPAAAERP